MAYRIFFSGLMVFVEYNDFNRVDVLLLNPCAGHQHPPGAGEHTESNHERECLDRHIPQLTVRASDIAEWKLAGTLHGCGSHHFDLTGKVVFPAGDPGKVFSDQAPPLDTSAVDPFGDMRHVSFKNGIVDMDEVLGKGNARIDAAKVERLVHVIGTDLIATHIRLPQGRLTALAPLDKSVRQVVRWQIGQQNRNVLCETVMFEAPDGVAPRIDLGQDREECVVLKNKRDATVWITAEPRVRTQFEPAKFEPANGFTGAAKHFEHYYELLQGGHEAAATVLKAHQLQARLPKPLPLTPTLTLALNIDTPPCPQALVHAP
jgi:hypothetical protein